MNKNIKKRGAGLWLVCVAGVLLAGCGDDTDSENRLPEGKYPMTFTAAVDGLAVSRATTGTDGKTSWVADDLVAISKDGGTSHKEYKITNASSGAMQPNNSGGVDNTLYWSKTEETLAAWHPATCTIGSGSGEVSITNQSSDFGTLENILYAPAASYTYSSSGSVAFTFRHALAKVNVTLQKESGKSDFTDTEISDASVTFMGYTAGTLGYGGMTGSGNNGEIVSKKETPGGGTATYTALLIPQQMQNEKFIKVTIGTDAAARDYYYIPTDNKLEAGKQYDYTITVKKTGLEVTVTGNGTSWTDESITGTNDTDVTFLITAPTSGVTIAAVTGGGTLTGSSSPYTLSGGNAITVTVDASSQSGKFLKSLPAKGIYDITSGSYASGSYTYTYILKSDLSFSEPVFVEKTTPALGDFYYLDGTWSAELWDKPCIGIVFKVGAGTNDALNDYQYSGLTGQINGYAVAVQDAARFGIKWSTVQENCGTSTTNDYKGYDNTAKVLCISSYSETTYPVFWAIYEFGETTVAPSGTSGWYLPSAGQMIDIVNSWKDNGIIRQKLDDLPYSYPWKTPTTDHGYATSTEDPDNASQNVCCISNDGSVVKEQKDNSEGNFAVRPILTF